MSPFAPGTIVQFMEKLDLDWGEYALPGFVGKVVSRPGDVGLWVEFRSNLGFLHYLRADSGPMPPVLPIAEPIAPRNTPGATGGNNFPNRYREGSCRPHVTNRPAGARRP